MKTLSITEGDRIIAGVEAGSVGTKEPTMCLVTVRYVQGGVRDMWMSWETVEDMAKVLTRACLKRPGPHAELLAELDKVVIGAEVAEAMVRSDAEEEAAADDAEAKSNSEAEVVATQFEGGGPEPGSNGEAAEAEATCAGCGAYLQAGDWQGLCPDCAEPPEAKSNGEAEEAARCAGAGENFHEARAEMDQADRQAQEEVASS